MSKWSRTFDAETSIWEYLLYKLELESAAKNWWEDTPAEEIDPAPGPQQPDSTSKSL